MHPSRRSRRAGRRARPGPGRRSCSRRSARSRTAGGSPAGFAARSTTTVNTATKPPPCAAPPSALHSAHRSGANSRPSGRQRPQHAVDQERRQRSAEPVDDHRGAERADQGGHLEDRRRRPGLPAGHPLLVGQQGGQPGGQPVVREGLAGESDGQHPGGGPAQHGAGRSGVRLRGGVGSVRRVPTAFASAGAPDGSPPGQRPPQRRRQRDSTAPIASANCQPKSLGQRPVTVSVIIEPTFMAAV